MQNVRAHFPGLDEVKEPGAKDDPHDTHDSAGNDPGLSIRRAVHGHKEELRLRGALFCGSVCRGCEALRGALWSVFTFFFFFQRSHGRPYQAAREHRPDRGDKVGIGAITQPFSVAHIKRAVAVAVSRTWQLQAPGLRVVRPKYREPIQRPAEERRLPSTLCILRCI